MPIDSDIAADLPAPRDDEPESLRRDIVDELADHLQCALQRELLAGGQASHPQQASPRRQSGDSGSKHTAREHLQADAWGSPDHAWQQVLTRFGNPATIARRLWFDAMKERLMAQRFTAIMAGITAASAIAVAILLWRGIDQQAQAAAAIQQSNAALLERLATLLEQQTPAAGEPTKERELRHLDLRLVQGDPEGPPAVGYRLAPAGVASDESLVRLTDPRTDEEGRARLSMNRVGQFFLSITTPDGWVASTLIPMGPEHPQEMTLVVPAPAPPLKDLTIHIPRPNELSEQEYIFEVTLARPTRTLGELEWYYAPEGSNAMSGREDRLLVAGDGRIIGRVIDIEDSRQTGGPPQVVFKTLPIDELPAGEYSIQKVEAFEPLDDPQEKQRDRLGAVTPFSYKFADGTTKRSVVKDGADWTIELPGFVWDRDTDGVQNAQTGGGGFF
jgi:hypothetical protein